MKDITERFPSPIGSEFNIRQISPYLNGRAMRSGILTSANMIDKKVAVKFGIIEEIKSLNIKLRVKK